MTGDFDTDILGLHPLPFAAYIDPDGYHEIKKRKSMRDADYARWVPQTHQIAHKMYSSLTQVDCWGKQIFKRGSTSNEKIGGWVQETRRLPVNSYGGARPGKALAVSDLLKSLSRPPYYAVGRTDMHLETQDGLYGPITYPITQVACLCSDVDMDAAWATQDTGAIRQEVWRESRIAAAMGLTYRVFRTGGRGHQAVLPLPLPVDRSVASWLLTAFEGVLRPWHERDGSAVADASNLEKLVRMAGGRHIKTGRLALWIDPIAGSLYELPVQAELMASGYRTPETNPLRQTLFAEAAAEISDYLAHKHGVRRYECLPPLKCDSLIAETTHDLAENLLVESVVAAQELYGLTDTVAMLIGPTGAVSKTSQADRANLDALSALTPDTLHVWAERVWAIPWGEGTYWDWIREGGARGITAAKLLFGGNALNKLLARTKTAPHTTLGEPDEWVRSIRALYAKHTMQSFESADARRLAKGCLPEDGKALIPMITETLHAHHRILPRNRDDVECLIRLLLIAFQDASTGFIDVSLDTLHCALKLKLPASTMSRSGLQRHLLRLRGDKPECGYALMNEIILDRTGQNQATRFRPGPDLRATPFGASLPIDECRDHVPQSEPLRLHMRTLGGLQWREKAQKPRGRKRKTQQEEQEGQ